MIGKDLALLLGQTDEPVGLRSTKTPYPKDTLKGGLNGGRHLQRSQVGHDPYCCELLNRVQHGLVALPKAQDYVRGHTAPAEQLNGLFHEVDDEGPVLLWAHPT